MNAYYRRGITTEEKLEIVVEFKKFDTKNVTKFFRRLNDAEQNDMIGQIAFSHLQGLGHYAKHRENFEGKTKTYQIEKSLLDSKKPEDFCNDLKKQNIQYLKKFNVFISHSSIDEKLVEEVITHLNIEGKVSYCDRLMDSDYLKRNFVSDYTKQVLKIRMEQSDILLIKRDSPYGTIDNLKSFS